MIYFIICSAGGATASYLFKAVFLVFICRLLHSVHVGKYSVQVL